MHHSRLNILLLLLLLVGTVSPATAQSQSVAETFAAMPDTLVPFLPDSVTRLSLIERSGKGVTTADPFGGTMTMEYMTDEALMISLGEHSTIEMALLPYQRRESCICMIITSLLSPAQSYITFFTPEWKPIEDDTLFSLPDLDHLVSDLDSRETKSALVERGHLNWTATIDKSSPRSLIVRVTSFDDETAHSLHPSMRESIRSVRMTWSGAGYQTK